MGKHNIIELNGKRYDALTGALLGASSTTPVASKIVAPVTKPAPRGRVIDGFVRAKAPNVSYPAAHAKKARVQTTPITQIAKPVKTSTDVRKAAKSTSHASVKIIAARQPEKPKTLMRRAVHKPKMSMKPAIKPQAPAEMMAEPIKTIAPKLTKKLSVKQVSPVRLVRARQTPKSHQIQRFSPQQAVRSTRIAAPTIAPTTPVQVAGKPAQAHPITAARPQATRPPQAQHNIFEAAIARATSHQEPAHKLRRRSHRLLNVTAGVTAFLLIGGFITFLNLTNIQLHVASARAGFHVALPSYKSTGYNLQGGIQSESGKVGMSFRSGSSHYTLTQQPSDWDSQTLLDNYVATAGGKHQTVESRGRTIYLFNDNNAVWVNGGVRYDINASEALRPDEVASLASSM